MLQPDPAHAVGHCQQEIVVIEMARAENRVRLVDQLFEGAQVFRCKLEIFGRIGHCIERDFGIERPLLGIEPCEDRRIDQRFVIDRFPGHRVAAARLAIECGEHFPPLRNGDRRLERDAARVMAFGIEAHRFPLKVEHFLRHRDPSLAAGDGRGVHELRCYFRDTFRHVDHEAEYVERIAFPFEWLAVGAEADVRQQVDLPASGMFPRQPFGKQEGQFAHSGRRRDSLGNRIDRTAGIGGIDIKSDRSTGPRRILGQWSRIAKLRRDRRGVGIRLGLERARDEQGSDERSGNGGDFHGGVDAWVARGRQGRPRPAARSAPPTCRRAAACRPLAAEAQRT